MYNINMPRLPRHNIIVIIGIFSLMDIAAQACSEIKVSGAIFQKGIEGEYELQGICEDTGNSDLYIQTKPAAGWGSVFYLYHYYRPGEDDWKGWIFSMYPCSDIAFARSASDASTPDMVEQPWEEYLMDDFHSNPDILVKCKGIEGTGLHYFKITILTAICLIALVLIVIIPITILRRFNSTSRCESESTDEMNTNSMVQEEDDAVYIPQPPLYEEIANASDLPPSYADIKSGQEEVGYRSAYVNMAAIVLPPPEYNTSSGLNYTSNNNGDVNNLNHDGFNAQYHMPRIYSTTYPVVGSTGGRTYVCDEDTYAYPNYTFVHPVVRSGHQLSETNRSRHHLQPMTNTETEYNVGAAGHNAVHRQIHMHQHNNHAHDFTVNLPPSYEVVINENSVANA